ncbi:redox-regulated ATPase YchF [Alkaliphilus hydrothermalis]|uniref:Ribosome-binding ATPase YchF n=1 Tax=Alkaliphilus hydrothermalis TaxID=1482730 RepID=A0ABS2NPT4_9FIRM|nr:redox-regulated ATPase YchF [Alkaliphilus hydrothermalis]MBM7614604.1 GTP-binding protein YchF [Alkaliphilus hydrothermalis]
MKLGIVGLPNVGKSTLFNAITQAGAESANYPFCTIEPNVGVVAVPDERLTVLRDMHSSEKVIPAAIEFYDIAGLVRGASKGEGLGNKFLSHIREVSAILHVVRCFEDSNITHVDGDVNPLRDIETINLELIFSDLEMVEKRIQKQEKLAKSDKSLLPELDLLKRIREALEDGKSARSIELTDEEAMMIRGFNLLSTKPIIYVTNVDENDIQNLGADNSHVAQVKELATTENAEVVTICAKIEAEISELEDEEKSMFLEELGLSESGLDRLIKASYSLLGLISYLTAGPKEVRAWTIKNGLKAPQAAGKIHSDFERGFIRAEVVAFDDLVAAGSHSAAKDKGWVRLEGKEYIVKDGDVILFRFNV